MTVDIIKDTENMRKNRNGLRETTQNPNRLKWIDKSAGAYLIM